MSRDFMCPHSYLSANGTDGTGFGSKLDMRMEIRIRFHPPFSKIADLIP